MVITRFMLVLTACFAILDCNPGMDDILGRTTDDPFQDIPVVRSFNGDFSVIISWREDEAADKYFLYRAADALNPEYDLIYEGSKTEYRDVFSLPQNEKLYLYRLGKKRGGKLFVDLTAHGKAGLGVVSGSQFDFQENNNSIADATLLGSNVLASNCWFYCSNYKDDISIYDEDWYYVNVPAHWKAIILLNDNNAVPGTQISHFKLEKRGIGSEDITSGFPVEIINNTDNAGALYFRIYPDFNTFKSQYTSASGGGGRFISYTINVSAFNPR